MEVFQKRGDGFHSRWHRAAIVMHGVWSRAKAAGLRPSSVRLGEVGTQRRKPGVAGTDTLQVLTVDAHDVQGDTGGRRLEGACMRALWPS